MKKWVLIFLICFLWLGCRVTVKTHHGFMSPEIYEATDGNISVYYYDGSCCCVAKKVLENLAYKANTGGLDWKKMEDESYQKQILSEECEKIKIKENFK